jgi:predicted metal-dependent HD superfamily phosphohydrolase
LLSNSHARARRRALALFEAWDDPRFVYHDRRHTLDVQRSAMRLGRLAGLSVADRRLLSTAALFHDIGISINPAAHEAASARICRAELPPLGYAESEISAIAGMILATRLPQTPENLLESLLCDADLDYLGREDYPQVSERLRLEMALLGQAYDRRGWLDLQFEFIEGFRYRTAEARALREEGRLRNLERLQRVRSGADAGIAY